MRICIDAGHGGRDPGAVGIGRTFEKNVVFNIALELEELLTDAGAEVIQTRRTDILIPLSHRAEIAQRADADIFVSLHCNGFSNPTVNGVETFFRKVSDKRSRLLAECVQRELLKTKWRDRGIKTNNRFTVLRNTSPIPAILIEYNFITNPVFERELADKEVQEKLAELTFKGINEFARREDL